MSCPFLVIGCSGQLFKVRTYAAKSCISLQKIMFIWTGSRYCASGSKCNFGPWNTLLFAITYFGPGLLTVQLESIFISENDSAPLGRPKCIRDSFWEVVIAKPFLLIHLNCITSDPVVHIHIARPVTILFPMDCLYIG